MDYIEVTGKSVEDAITNASVKLGVPSSKLDYVVVEKGSKGFLGINSKPAVIKAKAKDDEDEFEKISVKPLEVKQENPVPKKVEKEVKKAPEKVVEKVQEKPVEVKKSVEEVDEEVVIKSSKKCVAGPNMESAIVNFLTDVLGAMGMTAKVEVKIDEPNGTVEVNLDGKDMGVLIGKRGQTLDSLQYLVSLVANRECEGYFRVKLDTENYRQRRKETLESLARNISYKVKRTRRPVSLEPMNPYERRIIHSALQNDKYVATKSEGEEPFRHVVVYLKKNQ